MGRLFMEHHGGVRYYECANCKNYLCNAANIISKHFFGASGRAILFQNVVNVNMGEMEQKQMATGLHHARDIFCQKCKMKLGWMYEMAHNESQMYKEGKFVLERKYIKKCKGFEDGEKCSSPGTAESSTQPSPIASDVEQ
ncbi:Protein yippee-like 5 [Strongyloides ratti]|uniref:Protein yippee-like n=1 Tax=Strongyloides ratti TaxID=34506 RepID=A0A090L607_STRRB|nr:Protein yippee-like 5 [Strongyloides ratti]CEF65152.1 Protein yippee-like 5 [Strongyloides ratti]